METVMRSISDWLVGNFGIFGIFILLCLIMFYWTIPIFALVGVVAVCYGIMNFVAWVRRGFKPDPNTRYESSSGYCGSYSGSSEDPGFSSDGGNDGPGDHGPTPDYGRGY